MRCAKGRWIFWTKTRTEGSTCSTRSSARSRAMRATAQERARLTRVARALRQAHRAGARSARRMSFGDGLNKQIAGDLGIHERTVKLHRTSSDDETGRAVGRGTHAAVARGGIFTARPSTFP